MTDQLTDEAVKALLDRVPEFAGILRKQASLSRDLHLSSNLHNAADWMDYLARALLDARAENARLRADAQAAVALVLEQAAQLAEDGLLSVDGGLAAQEIRALAPAPADGVAAVEALRKERDLAVAQNDRLWAANHNLVAEQDALTAELDAAQQREAGLRVAIADMANSINVVGGDYDKAIKAIDGMVSLVKQRSRAALAHNGRGE